MTVDKAELLLETKSKGLSEAAKALDAIRNKATSVAKAMDSITLSIRNSGSALGKTKKEMELFYKDLNRYSKGTTRDQIANATLNREISAIKARERKLASAVIVERDRLLKESLKSKKTLDMYQAMGIDINTAHKMPISELQKAFDAYNSAQKEQIKKERQLQKEREAAARPAKEQKTIQQKRAEKVSNLTGDSGAALFAIQSELMVNYLLMNQVFNLISFGSQFVLQLDKAFADLQATIGATNGQMEGLKSTIIDVSTGTKFTAVEIAQAALTLGQAGFSIDQIKSSIEGVSLLATATGSTLSESTDVATSAISVFNLRAEDMTHVANVMTAAINDTKLTMEKLSYSLQYAGNIADEAGLSFEETTAVLGAMANSGIKSGSTLGTGLRQLLTEFMAPTDKLAESLQKVGLGLDDVDIKALGFVGVMEKLKAAGFSTSDAFESLDLRAAAAFAAIQNKPQMINELQKSFVYTTAAARANEIQMGSLANTFDQFRGALGAFINTGAQPTVTALIGVTKNMSSALTYFSEFRTVVELAGTAVGAFAIALTAIKLSRLIMELGALTTAVKAYTAAANKGAAVTGIFSSFVKSGAAIGGLTVALTGLMYIYDKFSTSSTEARNKLDDARTSFQNAKEAVNKTEESITSVDEATVRLNARFAELKDNPQALRTEIVTLNARFGELGLAALDLGETKIASLIDALGNLKQSLKETSQEQLTFAMQERALLTQREAEFAKSQIRENLRNQAKAVQQQKYSFFDSLPGTFQSPGVPNIRNAIQGSPELAQAYQVQSKLSTTPLASITDVKELDALENDVNKALSSLRTRLGTIRGELSKIEAAKSKGEKYDENLLEILKLQESSYKDAMDLLSNSTAGISQQSLLMMEKLNKAVETTPLYKAFEVSFQKYQEKLSEFDKQLRDAKSDEAKDKIRQEIEVFIKNFQESIPNFVKANLDDISKDVLKKSTGGIEVSNEELVKSLQGTLDTKIKQVNSEQEHKLDNAFHTTTDSLDKITDGARTFVEMQKQMFDNLGKKYQREIDRLDIVARESQDLETGGLAGKYTDAELFIFEKRKKQLKAKQLKEQIDNSSDYVGSYDNLIKAQQTKIARSKAEDKAKAEKELLDIQKERQDVLDSLASKEDEYNAIMGIGVEKNVELGVQIREVLKAYSEQAKVQASLGYNIKQNITEALDSAKSSFSDFTFSILSGTKSISGAFREMAGSIVESMLRMQIDKMSSSVLGYATDFLAGAVGSYFGGSSTGTSIANPNIAGTSYLTSATGGDVLRNQAVEMIGRETLDSINGLGARTVDSSNSNLSAINTQKTGGTAITNVYVVPPEQKPSLSKGDVLVTITEDMLKGGQTKKLVKAIAQGGL